MIKTKAMKKYDCIVVDWIGDWILLKDWFFNQEFKSADKDRFVIYCIQEQLIAVREGWTE